MYLPSSSHSNKAPARPPAPSLPKALSVDGTGKVVASPIPPTPGQCGDASWAPTGCSLQRCRKSWRGLIRNCGQEGNAAASAGLQLAPSGGSRNCSPIMPVLSAVHPPALLCQCSLKSSLLVLLCRCSLQSSLQTLACSACFSLLYGALFPFHAP